MCGVCVLCVWCVVCGVRVLCVCVCCVCGVWCVVCGVWCACVVCVYHNVYVPRDLLNLRNFEIALRNLKIWKLRTDFETVLRFIKNCHPISKLH